MSASAATAAGTVSAASAAGPGGRGVQSKPSAAVPATASKTFVHDEAKSGESDDGGGRRGDDGGGHEDDDDDDGDEGEDGDASCDGEDGDASCDGDGEDEGEEQCDDGDDSGEEMSSPASAASGQASPLQQFIAAQRDNAAVVALHELAPDVPRDVVVYVLLSRCNGDANAAAGVLFDPDGVKEVRPTPPSRPR